MYVGGEGKKDTSPVNPKSVEREETHWDHVHVQLIKHTKKKTIR